MEFDVNICGNEFVLCSVVFTNDRMRLRTIFRKVNFYWKLRNNSLIELFQKILFQLLSESLAKSFQTYLCILCNFFI